MRGFPLVNLLVVAVVLAVTGWWPLRRAARVAPPAPQAVSSSESDAETVPAWVSLRFAHVPERAEVRQSGEVVAECAGDWSGPVSLSVVEGVAELEVTAAWPEGTGDTVVEVRVEPDGLPARTENVWSDGPEAAGLVQFQWNPGP